jgi:hypothetical protein
MLGAIGPARGGTARSGRRSRRPPVARERHRARFRSERSVSWSNDGVGLPKHRRSYTHGCPHLWQWCFASLRPSSAPEAFWMHGKILPLTEGAPRRQVETPDG